MGLAEGPRKAGVRDPVTMSVRVRTIASEDTAWNLCSHTWHLLSGHFLQAGL